MKILAQVECLKGSRLKYEIDHQGRLILDRVISMPFPCAYGSIPNTKAPDGDPMDVFILNLPKGVKKGTLVMVSLVGVICMTDNGVQDDKYLGVVEGTYSNIYAYHDVQKFLVDYKSGTQVEITDDLTIPNYVDLTKQIQQLQNPAKLECTHPYWIRFNEDPYKRCSKCCVVVNV